VLEAAIVVGVAAGLLSNLRGPVYQATARVLLTPNDPTQQLNPTTGLGVVGNDPDRYVVGQISIAESEAVKVEAVKFLPGVSVKAIEGKVSVSQGGRSNVLNITAAGADPVQARDIANAVAKGYIENQRKAAVSGLQGAAGDIEARLVPLQSQIAQLDGQIGDGSTIPGASATLVSPVNPDAKLAPGQPAPQVPPAAGGPGGAPTTAEALKAARYAAAVQYETLYSRQQELLVDISLKRGDATLISEAKTPASPASPRPKRDAVLGAFVGLLLGIGVSVLREQLNDKVRSADEVEQLTGLPLLAQLPYDGEAAEPGVAVDQRPSSPLSEAMRSLRTSIQYQGVDQPVKVMVVTSALPGEGKSLVAANLSVAFAQAGYRAVLISADLRRPSVNGIFGNLGASPGLIGIMTSAATNGRAATSNGQATNGQATNGHATNGHGAVDARAVGALLETPIEGLKLLPSGPAPPNPAELLGSRRMIAILAELSAVADVIVIDSPPLLPVTDAAVLASKCDGLILVTASNETPRDALKRSKTILDGTGARVLGFVVNKSRRATSGYYEGGYYAGGYGTSGKVEQVGREKRDLPVNG